MAQIAAVGVGGFLGSILRYLLSGWVHKTLASDWFPYGTLAVNVIGCLLIGFLAGVEEKHSLFTADVRLFIFIGIVGGFTTFSAFAYETVLLARNAQMLTAFANVFLELTAGLFAVSVGHWLSRF
ncbi:MAG TPA: fluoride efflux transporter CrcB [Candidatus Binatia bacterium]|jgi:CrcB protein